MNATANPVELNSYKPRLKEGDARKFLALGVGFTCSTSDNKEANARLTPLSLFDENSAMLLWVANVSTRRLVVCKIAPSELHSNLS